MKDRYLEWIENETVVPSIADESSVADCASVDRLAGRVLARLARRRRRRRLAAGIAAGLVIASLGALATRFAGPGADPEREPEASIVVESSPKPTIVETAVDDATTLPAPDRSPELPKPDSLAARVDALRQLARTRPREAVRKFWETWSLVSDGPTFSLEGFPAKEVVEDSIEATFLRASLWSGTELARHFPAESILQELSRSPRRDRRVDPPRFLAALARSRVPVAWSVLRATLVEHGPQDDILTLVGELEDPRAIPYLERWILVADERGRRAIEALARIPGDNAVRKLLLAFESHEKFAGVAPDSRQAARAARAALRRRSSETLAYIEAELESSGQVERHLRILAAAFPEEAVTIIARRLEGGRPDHAAAFVRQLVAIDSREAIEVLVDSLSQPNLRPLARRALGRITPVDFGDDLERWRNWLETRSRRRENQTRSTSPLPSLARRDLVPHPFHFRRT